MGAVKALVEVDGLPMARQVADALVAGGADGVGLVGGDAEIGARLGLVPMADRWPGLGPLGGLATAALDAGSAFPDGEGDVIVVVAACDQPGLSADAIARLVDALAAAGPEVVAAVPVGSDGRRHPFPSAWWARAGPALGRLVDGGARRADAAFDVGPVVDVATDEAELVDLDTPADVARWGDRSGSGGHRLPRSDGSDP